MATEEATRTGGIQKTPGICGGRACINDRRIPVWLLVQTRRIGVSDTEHLRQFDPPLTQAELDSAWSYYSENTAEIDRDIAENDDDLPKIR